MTFAKKLPNSIKSTTTKVEFSLYSQEGWKW